jgi:hypothetical protein
MGDRLIGGDTDGGNGACPDINKDYLELVLSGRVRGERNGLELPQSQEVQQIHEPAHNKAINCI